MRKIAVCIPTRTRAERLRKTLDSLYDNAKSVRNFDVFVKIDHDDVETLGFCEHYGKKENFYTLIGPRIVEPYVSGYASLGHFYNMLFLMAQCEWLWMFNDDAFVEGENWDEKILEFDERHPFLQPEITGLNESRYINEEGGAFPIIRKDAFEWTDATTIRDPVDYAIIKYFREKSIEAGFVKGLTVQHLRDSDEELERHRK